MTVLIQTTFVSILQQHNLQASQQCRLRLLWLVLFLSFSTGIIQNVFQYFEDYSIKVKAVGMCQLEFSAVTEMYRCYFQQWALIIILWRATHSSGSNRSYLGFSTWSLQSTLQLDATLSSHWWFLMVVRDFYLVLWFPHY